MHCGRSILIEKVVMTANVTLLFDEKEEEESRKKRQAAADSLHGIWADLPANRLKSLMKKTY
jgi:hypothetical protein